MSCCPASPASRFEIKQGSLQPILSWQILEEATGLPKNLTDATAVTVRLRHRASGLVLIRTGQVSDTPTDGRGLYPWVAGDTDRAGLYDGEVAVGFGPGGASGALTAPSDGYFEVEITPRL